MVLGRILLEVRDGLRSLVVRDHLMGSVHVGV